MFEKSVTDLLRSLRIAVDETERGWSKYGKVPRKLILAALSTVRDSIKMLDAWADTLVEDGVIEPTFGEWKDVGQFDFTSTLKEHLGECCEIRLGEVVVGYLARDTFYSKPRYQILLHTKAGERWTLPSGTCTHKDKEKLKKQVAVKVKWKQRWQLKHLHTAIRSEEQLAPNGTFFPGVEGFDYDE